MKPLLIISITLLFIAPSMANDAKAIDLCLAINKHGPLVVDPITDLKLQKASNARREETPIVEPGACEPANSGQDNAQDHGGVAGYLVGFLGGLATDCADGQATAELGEARVAYGATSEESLGYSTAIYGEAKVIVSSGNAYIWGAGDLLETTGDLLLVGAEAWSTGEAHITLGRQALANAVGTAVPGCLLPGGKPCAAEGYASRTDEGVTAYVQVGFRNVDCRV